MKKKENKESRETQITTMSVFGLTFHIKNYILLENIVWNNSLQHHILFTVFMSCKIFETQ